MPSSRQTKRAGLALSVFVSLAAGALALRQRTERLKRDPDLSPLDARHFQSQDRRRAAGALVMFSLAAGLAAGSSLPHLAGGRSNPAFLIVWFVVFVLILLLLVLAFVDLLATRLYARRQHRALVRERLDILRDEARRRGREDGRWNASRPPGNGFPH